MATLDEITKEKQRLARRLHASMLNARSLSASSVNWKRSSVCSHAIARARSQGRRPQPKCRPRDEGGCSSATTPTPAQCDCKISWRQPQLAQPQRSGSCLATGKTQQEITAACKGARPNHVGAAIARHKRAGRVEERDGKLYATAAGRSNASRSEAARKALSRPEGIRAQVSDRLGPIIPPDVDWPSSSRIWESTSPHHTTRIQIRRVGPLGIALFVLLVGLLPLAGLVLLLGAALVGVVIAGVLIGGRIFSSLSHHPFRR